MFVMVLVMVLMRVASSLQFCSMTLILGRLRRGIGSELLQVKGTAKVEGDLEKYYQSPNDLFLRLVNAPLR
jgi:hypothetical protein